MFINSAKIRLKKRSKRIIKSLAVFLLVASWLLTGYPGFWLSPVRAATTTVFLTTADSSPWTVPNNWGGMVSIEVIGGGQGGTKGVQGGNGGVGGDGGGYAKITSGITTTAGSTISFQVGTGGSGGSSPGNGGDTWFSSTSTVLANGGGSSTSRVGSVTYAGGAGGTASYKGGGGGGGAAGPIKTTTGIGKDGGDSLSSALGGGGGGGAEGDSATAGGTTIDSSFGSGGKGWSGTGGGSTAGAAGTAGTGGGGAGSNGNTTTSGGSGATGTNIDSSHGSGGGGGGGGGTDTKNSNNCAAGGNGGLYGGGGGGSGGTNNRAPKTAGNGADGLIIITYTIDDSAPTPNPMTFATSPNNNASGQISMVASQASDNFVAQSAISYLFTNDNTACTSGHEGTGGDSSSWQLNDRNYTDTGLDVNKCYGYKVQAKDTAGNTTTASSVAVVYSSASTPGTPTLNTPTASTLTLTNAEGSNPLSNPTTTFAAQMTTTSPADSTWLYKWIDGTGNPSDTAVWLTDAQLDSLVIQGLQPSTLYGVQVKARNYDGDETSLSSEGDGTTSSPAGASFTQNNFRFYVTANSVTLTDPWSTVLDLAEKAVLTQLPTQNLTLKNGDRIRMKMNFYVSTANLSASSQAFQLEYTAAEDCTTAGGWTAVGAKASGSIWRLYDETSIGDSTVEVNNLSDSTTGVEGYYSEINPSAVNPNAVGYSPSQYSEWDWPVENNGAAENTTYCFRMAKSGGTAFDTYNSDSYPKITTAPGTSVLMRHGNFFQNSVEKGFFWVN